MELPKWHETFIPILKVLSSGELMHYNELRKKVRDEHYSQLPQELLTMRTKSGDPTLLNRIGWGKSALKIAKLVEYPERGFVQITNKGTEILNKGTFTLQDYRKDPDVIAYEEAKQRKDTHVAPVVSDESPEDMVNSGIQAIESAVIDDIHEKLKTVDPYYFEIIVLKLLKAMGYGDVIETSKSGDGGIDGIVNQDHLGLEKIYIQAKRYAENKVRELDMRNFIGAMYGGTPKGIFVTTSEFDQKAIDKARDTSHSIILIDGQKLSELMYKHNVGVQIRDVYEIKQIDEDFFEEE